MTRPPRVGLAAVVFDLDGTLVDTMTIAPTVYVDTIRALGGPEVSPATVVATWHIGATPFVLAHLLGRPVSAEDVECYHRHFAATVADVRPFPGVPELADDLDRAGCQLGIFTAATRRTTALVLASTGLDRLFPVVVCGDDIAEPKPAPEGLLLACQRLGVDVAEAAYVGDAEVDLKCAEAARLLAIHARWGITSPAPAEVMVAHRPADVLELLAGPAPGSPDHATAAGQTHRTTPRKDNP
ncbi:HAD family hydrolase [Micromonospora sp. NBC_00389]|uniref:HAD family hydrolase n=1 Tax=Micromonospora sp. NBC_00389 TaxID=2903586 RepID=UPI002E1F88C3